MTDCPPRFIIRKGTVRSTWMVWDRKIRAPAKLERGTLAAGLSEEQARQLLEQLTWAND